MSFNINGMDELMREFEKGAISDSDKERALTKAVNPLEKSIVDNSPVDTGDLKNSWKKEVKNNKATVSSNERYAYILEYGSSHTKKHMGYFSNAIEDAEDEVLNIIENELFKGWD